MPDAFDTLCETRMCQCRGLHLDCGSAARHCRLCV